MLADSEDIGRKDRLQFGKVLPPFDEREVSDASIEVQDIEGEHVDMDFDVTSFGGFS